MQKIFFITLILAGLFSACEPYEEFKGDNDFTTTYFPFQQPVRQLVVGDGINFHIGVVLGGRRENTQNEWVRFVIDESLVEGTPMTALPQSYYSLSVENEVAIPKGEFRGLIKVTLDSSLFVNDDSSYFQHYAIPLRITETSLDSILDKKDYTIFGVRAFNPYHAVYYHTGKSLTDSLGTVIDELMFTRPVSSNNAIWKVYSSSKNSVTTDGIGRFLSNDSELYRMRLDVDNSSNVSISSASNSLIEVSDLGNSKYNADDRSLTLNYSYPDTLELPADTIFQADTIFAINPAETFPVTKIVYDTLVFRNVPLAVEEWEMPEVE